MNRQSHQPKATRMELLLVYIALIVTFAIVATLIQPGGPF